MTIVFCSGTFDLTHPGHIWLFNKCKQYGNYLIVSVSPDVCLCQQKNRKRVLTQKQRMYIIKNICCVDEVIKQRELIPPKNVEKDLIKNGVDVYVCVKDDPFKNEYKNLCKRLGIKFVEIKRNNKDFFNISTTKILEALKK